MTRSLLVGLMLCALTASAQAAWVTYYEDHFDGGALNPAWTAWGTGAYGLVGSDLEFTTEQGDFHNAFEPTYGVPRHLFLINPPDQFTEWAAVTRVRYNTPDEYHEQVNLIAFRDHENSVKVTYNWNPAHYEHVVLSEQDGSVSQTPYATSGYTDYLWLRLERHGATYTAWASGDLTTNPDLVSWTLLGSKSNPMADPLVGIGGWNTYADASGELAEFDYFRLQVPEPTALALFAALFVVCSRRTR